MGWGVVEQREMTALYWFEFVGLSLDCTRRGVFENVRGRETVKKHINIYIWLIYNEDLFKSRVVENPVMFRDNILNVEQLIRSNWTSFKPLL